MSETKNAYYEMAKEWAEKYLSERETPVRVKFEAGDILDDISFLTTSLDRLVYGQGAEQRASYERIRKFKNIIEKTKPFVAQIN